MIVIDCKGKKMAAFKITVNSSRALKQREEEEASTRIKREEILGVNLADVDLKEFLRKFYLLYNEENISNISLNLENFKGEEILMLETLCAKYQVRNAELQRLLMKSHIKYDLVTVKIISFDTFVKFK